jgi:hypothetical protein
VSYICLLWIINLYQMVHFSHEFLIQRPSFTLGLKGFDLQVNLLFLGSFSPDWSTSKFTTIGPAYIHPTVTMHFPNLMALIHFETSGLRTSSEITYSRILLARVVSVGVDHLIQLLIFLLRRYQINDMHEFV